MLQRLRRAFTGGRDGVSGPTATDARQSRAQAEADPCALPRAPLCELQALNNQDVHTDIVRLIIAVDGGRLATAGDDAAIAIWDRHTGGLVACLRGHTGPVTALLLLDAQVLLSGSADRSVRVWSLAASGAHSTRVSGSSHFGNTASSLGLDDGEGDDRGGAKQYAVTPGYACLRQLSPRHTAAVKCLCPLIAGGHASFVSGGNDETLRIWSRRGKLVSEIRRTEEENLHALLAISAHRIVTASDSATLLVYRVDTSALEKSLPFHRESVRCLVRLSSSMFASASLDGAIVVWSSDALAPMRVLTQPEDYRNEHRVYISAVRSMLQLSERYLAATIGNGFAIFDVLTGWCICDGSGAHDAECTALASLYDGTRVISAGADALLRMWGFSSPVGSQASGARRKNGQTCALDHLDRSFSWRQTPPPLSSQEDAQLRLQQQALGAVSMKPEATSPTPPASTGPGLDINEAPSPAGLASPVTPKLIQPLGPANERQRSPILLGEMPGHSRSVEALLPLTETSLASCGDDHMVLLWKDGGAESELRSHFAAAFIQEQYHQRIEEAVQAALEDSLPLLREETLYRVADCGNFTNSADSEKYHSSVVRQLDY